MTLTSLRSYFTYTNFLDLIKQINLLKLQPKLFLEKIAIQAKFKEFKDNMMVDHMKLDDLF
jgi:hypothetical protein